MCVKRTQIDFRLMKLKTSPRTFDTQKENPKIPRLYNLFAYAKIAQH